MRVDLAGDEVAMTEQVLHGANVLAVFQKMGDVQSTNGLDRATLHHALVEVMMATLVRGAVHVIPGGREDPLPRPLPPGGGLLASKAAMSRGVPCSSATTARTSSRVRTTGSAWGAWRGPRHRATAGPGAGRDGRGTARRSAPGSGSKQPPLPWTASELRKRVTSGRPFRRDGACHGTGCTGESTRRRTSRCCGCPGEDGWPPACYRGAWAGERSGASCSCTRRGAEDVRGY